MRYIGLATTIVLAATLLGLIVIAVMSIPDIKRYLRIRSM